MQVANNVINIETYLEERQWETFTDRIGEVLQGLGLPNSSKDIQTMILILLHRVEDRGQEVYVATLERMLSTEHAEAYMKNPKIKEAAELLLEEWDSDERD